MVQLLLGATEIIVIWLAVSKNVKEWCYSRTFMKLALFHKIDINNKLQATVISYWNHGIWLAESKFFIEM